MLIVLQSNQQLLLAEVKVYPVAHWVQVPVVSAQVLQLSPQTTQEVPERYLPEMQLEHADADVQVTQGDTQATARALVPSS